uniref:Ig-like domain-containing protein n=1 Tax=Sparus aurata TaxID=8175 RepID=A0A671XLZ9_SPAAU
MLYCILLSAVSAFNHFWFMTFSTGLSLSEQVHQTPADMFKQPGGEAKISCFHTIPSYNRILWYKQTNGELQFLGYMNINTGYPENGAGLKIEGNANTDQNCTLTIEGLTLSSSAVYFCAASLHSATYH